VGGLRKQAQKSLVEFILCTRKKNLPLKMSKLILYGATISPPSRAVVMLVRALNLNVDIKYMNLLKNDQMQSDFMKVCRE
jgi:hypothetical protein